MPDMNKLLFIRGKQCDGCSPADSCDSCLQGYNAFGHALNNAISRGWNTLDAGDNNANKTYVESTINESDPGVIFGFGHGLQTIFTAQNRETIFSTTDCSNVKDRMIYLLSCLTGAALGPKMMENGALAYAGYNISWTWIADTDENNNFKYPDPYNDPYAQSFYDSAVALIDALTNGCSFVESVHAAVQRYNDWIQYWYEQGGSTASECIMWLAYDRDGLVALTGCEGIKEETGCLDAGCTWLNNTCKTLPTKTASASLSLLIPVILIAGIMFIAYKK